MNKNLRIVSFLLALVMTVSAFAACNSGDTETTTEASSQQATETAATETETGEN